MPELFTTGTVELQGVQLAPLSPKHADVLSKQMVQISPWSTLSFSQKGLATYLTRPDPSLHRYSFLVNEKIAGAMAIRSPWLRGPYLESLVVLPEFQGGGIGHKVLEWMEKEVRNEGHARNLWVACSSFNSKALEFYEAHGFQTTASLPGLVREDFDEILLRKQL